MQCGMRLYANTARVILSQASVVSRVCQDGHLILNVELDYMPRHLQLLQKYEVLETVVGIQINYGA